MTKLRSPFYNPGPGEVIKEELTCRGWKQEDLSFILDISAKHLNEIINNKKPISLELAKSLADVFGQEPQYWVCLDAKYRLASCNNLEKEEAVRKKAEIARYFPLNEMFKKGWLEKTRELDALLVQLSEFLKIELTALHQLPHVFDTQVVPHFRKSTAFTEFDQSVAKIWYIKAKNASSGFKVPRYDMTALANIYGKLHLYTAHENGVELFLEDLTQAGVKFLVLSHLQKTYLDGAAFKNGPNPVVVYTARYNRIDNFWFTIAHEIAHVLYHLQDEEVFIDNMNQVREEGSQSKEEEANRLAAEKLLMNEILAHFKNNTNYITEERIISFSKEKKLHPAIVVGMLAFNGIVSYVNLHRFSDTVRDKIPAKFKVEKSFDGE